MRTATTVAGKLNWICWFIFAAKDIKGEPNVEIHFVETAVLIPPPYQLDDTYLARVSFSQRKKLCGLMYDKMLQSPHYPFGTSSPTPHKIGQRRTRPPSTESLKHVAKAHVYKFDDKDEWLSVRCPTFPPFYVSHETVDKNKHYWHIRVVRPAMERYEFQFETFFEAAARNLNLSNTARLPSETHYFYKLTTLQRWYLCSEALRTINYIDETRIYNEMPDEPEIQNFKYTTNWRPETYLCFRCIAVRPMMRLRTGDTKNETNVIYIAIFQDENEVDTEVMDNHDIALDIVG